MLCCIQMEKCHVLKKLSTTMEIQVYWKLKESVKPNVSFEKRDRTLNDKPCYFFIFSPPVHVAQWAYMRHFLSVCPSLCTLELTMGHKKEHQKKRYKGNLIHSRPTLTNWNKMVTESQSHILRECETLLQNETSKITEAAITTEDTDTLKETATKIEETMRRLIADPPGTTPAAGAPADLGRGNPSPQPQ